MQDLQFCNPWNVCQASVSYYCPPISMPTQNIIQDLADTVFSYPWTLSAGIAVAGGSFALILCLRKKGLLVEGIEISGREEGTGNSACSGGEVTGKYVNTRALPNIGSRVQKSWACGHVTGKPEPELLFTMVPVSKQCTLKFPECVQDLNAALQSIGKDAPCIHPISEVRYWYSKACNRVVIVERFMKQGSLKDIIYNTRPVLPWNEKYGNRSEGLSVDRIAHYGRQILEAVLYLYNKGFPPLGHVQSGNAFVEADDRYEVCKLGGYENTLLGYKTRLYKLFKDHPEHIDVLMFGHLVFEMAAGYELTTTAPAEEDYEKAAEKDPQIRKELMFIFAKDHKGNFVHTIYDIHKRPFFTNKPLERILRPVHRGTPADNETNPSAQPTYTSTAGSIQQDTQLSQLLAILNHSKATPVTHSTFTPGAEDVESEDSVAEAASSDVREDTSKIKTFGKDLKVGAKTAGKSVMKGAAELKQGVKGLGEKVRGQLSKEKKPSIQ